MADIKIFKANKDYGRIKKGQDIHVTSAQQEEHFTNAGVIGSKAIAESSTDKPEKEVVKAIEKADSIEHLSALVSGDTRPAVVEAARKKTEELNKPKA